MAISIRKKSFLGFLAFLLGLSINDDIFAVFKYGSTYFYFGQFLSIFILLTLLLTNSKLISKAFFRIPIGLKVFFTVAILSPIIGAIFAKDIELFLYRSFVSILLFLINASTLVCVTALSTEEYKRSIIKGLFIGYVLNVVISLYAWLVFAPGAAFSFRDNVIRQYDYTTPLFVFRSQGLFLEPSHFIRYIILASFILIGYHLQNKRKFSFANYLLVFAVLASALLTTSGTLVIGFIGFIVFFILLFRNVSNNAKAYRIVMLLAVPVAFLAFYGLLSGSNLSSLINSSISGAIITNAENSPRYDSIVYGLSLIKSYPFGAGWGQTGTLFSYSSNVSCFSFVLSLVLEIGIIGTLIYFWSIFKLSVSLIKNRKVFSIALGCALIVLLAIEGGTDYAFDTFSMTLIGMSINALYEEGENRENITHILG